MQLENKSNFITVGYTCKLLFTLSSPRRKIKWYKYIYKMPTLIVHSVEIIVTSHNFELMKGRGNRMM